MRKGIRFGILAIVLTLVGCGDEGADEVRAPKGSPSDRPCIREVLNREFCLGGPIERLSDRRSVPLVSEYQAGEYQVYRYARTLPLAVSEETEARVISNELITITRKWAGPRDIVNELWREIISTWTDELGVPETSGKDGKPYYRWYAPKLDVLIVLHNGQSQPRGMDLLVLEIKGRTDADVAADPDKAQLVAEGLKYVSAAKQAFEKFVLSDKYNMYPSDSAEANFSPPSQYGESRVTGVDIESGQVVVRFDAALFGEDASLRFSPNMSLNGFNWTCQGVALRPEWLPEDCRATR